MKAKAMASVCGFAAVLAVASVSSAKGFLGEGTRDVCKKQVEEFIKTEMQTSVESVYWQYPSGDTGSTIAWVTTPACKGYIAIHIGAGGMTCKMSHYGSVPNYIRGAWGTDECAALVR